MCAIWCILWVKYAFMGTGIEVCIGVENHTGMRFPCESHGNGNSHMSYKGNANKTAEKV